MLCNCRDWDDALLAKVNELLLDEVPLPPGAPGGMESYRRTMMLSLFFKFYLTVLNDLDRTVQVSAFLSYLTYRFCLIKRTVRVEVGKIFCRRCVDKHLYNRTPQLLPIGV